MAQRQYPKGPATYPLPAVCLAPSPQPGSDSIASAQGRLLRCLLRLPRERTAMGLSPIALGDAVDLLMLHVVQESLSG